MNQAVIKWAGGVIVLMTLCGFIGSSAIRLNKIEKESEKVSKIEKDILIMKMCFKLQNPALYQKAEQLAN